MSCARLPRSLVLIAAILLTTARGAAAEDRSTEARRLYDEATAAFGVGNHLEAAEKYEASFKLQPQPALLYNAAQAYRMGGNKPRALQLYRNFVRLYGSNPRADDARNHAAALEKAIAEEGKAGGKTGGLAPAPAPTAPPTPEPAAPAPAQAPPGASLNAPPPRQEPAPSLVEPQAPPANAGDDDRSLVSRPWFWVALGAVVVGGTVAILFATRKDTYPDPTLGKLD